MSHLPTDATLNRRTALAGLGIGGIGFALATRPTLAHQDSADAMATHPIVGNWMVTTGAGPAMAVFLADGTNIQGLPATQAGPNGVEYVSTRSARGNPSANEASILRASSCTRTSTES